MLDEAKTKAYLDRIGFQREPSLDKETLDALVLAHQMSVPFETVTMHRSGMTPSLDLDDLYGKIVVDNGGGYCFELNKLFEALLVSLGFDARPVLSRAVRGRDGRMPINHRGIVVDIDGDLYSVDVGFGGPMPSGALLLKEGTDQHINGEVYAVCDLGGSWLAIERQTRANFDTYDDEAPVRRQVELELSTAPVEDIDFDALNMFFSRPGTLFHDHGLANLRTPEGYLALKDTDFTVRENGEKKITSLAGEDGIDAVLREHFGMRV